MMIFGNIKQIFPNFNLSIINNQLVMSIPIDDIINYLESELSKQLKSFNIEKYGDGILVRISLKDNLLPNLANLINNVIIEPEEIKIFIPYNSIVQALNLPDNINKNIIVNDKEIKIEISLY